MDVFSGLERRMASMENSRGAVLRFGEVTAVDEKAGAARVRIEDADNMVTMPLRVLQRRTLRDQHQELPDVGEHVACLFSGQGFEQGVVLGAVYSVREPAPGKPPHVWYRKFEDGTELEYDRESHKLVANVKGDAKLELDGELFARSGREAILESAERVLIKAPEIHLAGLLTATDVDGQAGAGVIHGNVRIVEGGLLADEDVLAGAGAVSLLDHIHTGVEPGPGVSDIPAGGGGGGFDDDENLFSDMSLAGADAPERLAAVASDPVDKTILCLPDIAAREAERESGADRQGWLYLHDMMNRWLQGPAITHPEDNPQPFWVEWEWVMSYARAWSAYAQFTTIPEDPNKAHNIYNTPSKKKIADYVANDLANGRLVADMNGCGEFDYTALPWKEWHERHFNHYTIDRQWVPEIGLRGRLPSLRPDGLQAALASFTLRALARGTFGPKAGGGLVIVVTDVSVYAEDRFSFQDEDRFFYWNCEKGYFSVFDPFDSVILGGSDFRRLQKSGGIGQDFLVLSELHAVEDFKGMRYEKP